MAEENTILAEDAEGGNASVTPQSAEKNHSLKPERQDTGENQELSDTITGENESLPESAETESYYESEFAEGPSLPEEEPPEAAGGDNAPVTPESPGSEHFSEPEPPASPEVPDIPEIPDVPEESLPPESVAAAAVAVDEGKSSPEEAKPKKKAKKTKKHIGILAGLLSRKDKTVDPYDMAIHGSLVNANVPDGYTLVEQYWVVPGCSEVMIILNGVTRQHEYHLNEPDLSEFEYEIVERLHADLRDVLILTDDEVMQERELVLRTKTIGLLDDYGVILALASYYRVMYYINRNFLGWARLEPLMMDPNLEDISCDGIGIPVFLYHRTYQNVKTNVTFDEVSLNSLAIRLSQRSGKHVSISNPVLDATLPDGSRLQLTYGSEVTTRGTSFTIRKFREEPFSPVELLMRGTFPADALAYFWIGIENNKNLLFVGGTASGKTSSLNAVALFLPQLSKVVSIEDTREITLYHENWIASVTRDAITDSAASKIDMFDLLKAAMRQRPEYIIVGEVRGNEAQTLFQAMNTGHTTFSTMHANNVDAAIHRLENQPLNVPRNMVQALDIVSIQALTYVGRERVRRSTEIVEIVGIDSGTGNLRVNNVFEYNPVTDVFRYSGRSVVYSAIMEQRGWTREDLTREVNRRIAVLNGMKDQGITDYIAVSRLLRAYEIDADSVMASIDDLKQALI